MNTLLMTNGIYRKVSFRYISEFIGLFANPEKCDTSSWNVYYYYYRQIHQKHIGLGVKSLKWFSLGYQMFFFLNALLKSRSIVGFWLDSFVKRIRFLDLDDLDCFFDLNGTSLFVFLTVVPVVMVIRAFKMNICKSPFLTSSAKEIPLIRHLGEYSSFDGLIQGITQSLVYTYARFLLCMLPAIIFVFVNENFPYHPTIPVFFHSLVFAFNKTMVPLACSVALALFFVIQPFCKRLDTLFFALLLFIEWKPEFGVSLLGQQDAFNKEQLFYFTPLMWVLCMFYFPFAAIDTFEYGIGRHAKPTRVLLLCIIAISLVSLSYRVLDLINAGYGDVYFTEASTFPALWFLGGILGLHISALSTASIRAKKRFFDYANKKKRWGIIRFFSPTSPASVIPICFLEIIFAVFFLVCLKRPYYLSFWLQPETMEADASRVLMFAFVLWSACHFALAIIQLARRYSRVDVATWHAHFRFNALVILFFEAFGNPELNKQMPYYPFAFYVVSVMTLFILWEPIEPNHKS